MPSVCSHNLCSPSHPAKGERRLRRIASGWQRDISASPVHRWWQQVKATIQSRRVMLSKVWPGRPRPFSWFKDKSELQRLFGRLRSAASGLDCKSEGYMTLSELLDEKCFAALCRCAM